MLGMMYGEYCGELNDYEAPRIPRPARRTSIDRSGRASELSLDLNDLQDMRETTSCSFSELSLSSWQQDICDRSLDQTSFTDLTKAGGVMPRYPSLDRVLEESGVTDCSQSFLMRSLDKIPDQLNEDSCTTFSKQQDSSSFRGPQHSRNYDEDENDNEECDRSSNCSQKRVHFARADSLEDVQEFQKPDADDYNLLYYMGHEIQKMMDDFKAELKLERSVVR